MTNELKKSFEVLRGKISAHSGHPSDDPYLYADESTGKEIGIDGRCNAAQLRLIAQWLDDVADVEATLIRCPDGAATQVALPSVQVPDVYNLSFQLADEGRDRASYMVLEIWHLAHDMLKQLKRGAGIET